MITVLAITQFVFLFLGTIFLKGMVNANGDITSSPYFQFLNKNWPWLFLMPVVGIGYAQLSYYSKHRSLPAWPAYVLVHWASRQ